MGTIRRFTFNFQCTNFTDYVNQMEILALPSPSEKLGLPLKLSFTSPVKDRSRLTEVLWVLLSSFQAMF